MWQDVERCRAWATVDGCDADAHILRISLGILDGNIKISVLGENSRIEQLVFQTTAGAGAIYIHQVFVGVLRMRVLVEIPHVGVSWRVIGVKIVLFDVFAVIAFAAGHSEKAFFQNRVFPVPECRCHAENLVTVANPGNAVFSPPVSLAACQVVGKVVPSGSIRAVIFPDRGP